MPEGIAHQPAERAGFSPARKKTSFGLLAALDRKVAWLLDAAAFTASLLVVGLMLYLVVARYVFGWSVVGLLELIMMFGMWLYMLGVLIASRRNEHLVVDFFEQQVKAPRVKAVLKIVIGCVTFATTVFFAMLAWRMLKWGFVRPQSTPGLGIPLWIPQSAILFAAAGCTLYALRDIVTAVGRLVRNSKD